MKLSGREYQQFHQALLSAFPRRADLEQMLLFQLGESLDTIVGSGSLSDCVFGLIQWAIARGRLGELITGARRSNSGNAELRIFAEQVWQAQSAEHSAKQLMVPAEATEHKHLEELLAIQHDNLYKLERQKAMHGGIDVPLLLLNQLDEVHREITKLEAQINTIAAPPPISHSQPTVLRHDTFSSYEAALEEFLRRLGAQHARYADALIYQQRLSENIDISRRYGDTEMTRAGRAQIIGQLNGLAQETLGISFNALM